MSDPVLACTPAELCVPAPVAGLEIVVVTAASPLSDVRENLDTNERGFDPSAEAVGDDAAAAFRASLDGGQAVTARRGGVAVGAGMHLPVRDGTAELTGITTLADHRDQGIGAAVTVALAELAFAQGATSVHLSTDNPVALRLYTRLGFRPSGGAADDQ
jgi:ribosomal protein S18 acetylase RimI-like enzyme